MERRKAVVAICSETLATGSRSMSISRADAFGDPVQISEVDRHADRLQSDRDRGTRTPPRGLYRESPALSVSGIAADGRFRQDGDHPCPRSGKIDAMQAALDGLMKQEARIVAAARAPGATVETIKAAFRG
jgi:hypothetical protein